MKLTEFYSEVSRRADTGKTSINAAETRRVLSEAFLVLHKLKTPEAIDVISKGIAQAAKKTAKK